VSQNTYLFVVYTVGKILFHYKHKNYYMITLRQLIESKQHTPLWQQDKAAIYKIFLQKRERKNTNRWSIVYKTFAYSISTLSVVGFILFGSFFGIFEQNPTELSQSVDAQSIGKIVSSKWTFAIYNNENRKIDTDTIQLSDRIIVDSSSTIKVLIHDSFTAEVVGPAQFEIILNEDKDNKNYNIKFINWGEYIAIDSVNNSINSHISVQTSDGVTVKKKQQNEFKKVSFAIQSIPGAENTKITNKSSSSLEVTTNTIDTSLLGQMTSKTINSSVMISPEQVVEITSQWTNDDGSITIISQQNINTTIPNEIVTKTPKKPSKTPIIIEETQKINENDIKKIKSNLHRSFLQKDYTSLVIYHFWWKENEYNIIKNNINDRLNRLAQIGKLPTNTDTSLWGIIVFAQAIQDHYQTLNIPQTAYKNLVPLIKRLSEVNKHTFWIIKQSGKDKDITLEHIYSLIDLQQNNNMYRFR
jgi:hypothetical protein